MSLFPLAYANDDERCHGAAGMALALVMMEGDKHLCAIDVDGDDGSLMSLVDAFYTPVVSSDSPRRAWNAHLQTLHLAVAMALGNVACRARLLHNTAIPSAHLDTLRQLARLDADAACSLTDEEADTLFRRDADYVQRMFAHPAVLPPARTLAQQLQQRRTLSRAEVLEILDTLTRY